MVCSMNVIIKPLSNDSEQIKIVREFLFKMIKKEFGYDYVPEWHEDIIKNCIRETKRGEQDVKRYFHHAPETPHEFVEAI